jgi:segregation and condensation protein A
MSDKKTEGKTDLEAVADPAAPETASAAYKVRLENYFGPLDLLLHLVKEAEVDVTRIALAQVADQYAAYISAMQKLDIELAGEFLSMASQLLLIKSRTLAPPDTADADDGDEEEEGDASLELIRKLLDYKRFKDRARALDRMMEERSQRHGRPRLRIEGETALEPLRNLELWDLVLMFSRVLKSTRLDVAMSILYREVPLETYMDHILAALIRGEPATLFGLLGAQPDRVRIVGTFLAMLQLARDGRVTLSQDAELGDIRIAPVPEAPAAPADAPPPAGASDQP